MRRVVPRLPQQFDSNQLLHKAVSNVRGHVVCLLQRVSPHPPRSSPRLTHIRVVDGNVACVTTRV